MNPIECSVVPAVHPPPPPRPEIWVVVMFVNQRAWMTMSYDRKEEAERLIAKDPDALFLAHIPAEAEEEKT